MRRNFQQFFFSLLHTVRTNEYSCVQFHLTFIWSSHRKKYIYLWYHHICKLPISDSLARPLILNMRTAFFFPLLPLTMRPMYWWCMCILCVLMNVICVLVFESSLEHIVYTVKAKLSYPSVTQFFFRYLLSIINVSKSLRCVLNPCARSIHSYPHIKRVSVFHSGFYSYSHELSHHYIPKYIQIVLHNRMLCSSKKKKKEMYVCISLSVYCENFRQMLVYQAEKFTHSAKKKNV